MKKTALLAPVAAFGLLLSSTAIYAQTTSTDTRSVSASVSGALMGDTGFMTGGQVQVGGVGQGSVTLARGNAEINVLSGARSSMGLLPPTPTSPYDSPIPMSQSSMITTFDFNRDVNTSGALVGIGTMVAQGESLGGVAVVGSSNANATRAGTGTSQAAGAGSPTSGSSSTPTTATGSLVGNFSTANTMQLVGTGALFAGSQALNLGERNVGASAGRTGAVAANASDINLDSLTFAATPASGTSFAPTNVTAGTNGAGFMSRSTLNGTNGTIAMNVSNAGNGSVTVSASTGGFFGQGTTFGASAAPTFANIGFFNLQQSVQP